MINTFLFGMTFLTAAVPSLGGISAVYTPYTSKAEIAVIKNKQEVSVETAKVAQELERHYIVEDGDTILMLARRFNVVEKHLREVNKVDAGVKLVIGQDLIIPEQDWTNYEGVASWYGPGFHGRVMANGDLYDQNKILVAHRTLPLGSKVKVTNPKNGKTIIAPVLDRGPYIIKDGEYTREIDLSYAAAKELGTIGAGLAPVKIEVIEDEQSVVGPLAVNLKK